MSDQTASRVKIWGEDLVVVIGHEWFRLSEMWGLEREGIRAYEEIGGLGSDQAGPWVVKMALATAWYAMAPRDRRETSIKWAYPVYLCSEEAQERAHWSRHGAKSIARAGRLVGWVGYDDEVHGETRHRSGEVALFGERKGHAVVLTMQVREAMILNWRMSEISVRTGMMDLSLPSLLVDHEGVDPQRIYGEEWLGEEDKARYVMEVLGDRFEIAGGVIGWVCVGGRGYIWGEEGQGEMLGYVWGFEPQGKWIDEQGERLREEPWYLGWAPDQTSAEELLSLVIGDLRAVEAQMNDRDRWLGQADVAQRREAQTEFVKNKESVADEQARRRAARERLVEEVKKRQQARQQRMLDWLRVFGSQMSRDVLNMQGLASTPSPILNLQGLASTPSPILRQEASTPMLSRIQHTFDQTARAELTEGQDVGGGSAPPPASERAGSWVCIGGQWRWIGQEGQVQGGVDEGSRGGSVGVHVQVSQAQGTVVERYQGAQRLRAALGREDLIQMLSWSLHKDKGEKG